MPILPGKSHIGSNIKEMEAAGHPRDQSIAAALNVARKHRAQGGITASKAREIAHDVIKEHTHYPAPLGHKGLEKLMPLVRQKKSDGGLTINTPKFKSAVSAMHTGPIHSSVAGRTDHLPIHVPSGSYVLPADIISGAPGAEGNTMAGFAHAKRVFGGVPRGGGEQPYDHEGGPYGMAAGGAASGVPIVAAGGEYVVPPDAVREVGGGDLDTGHKVLDEFVKRVRQELIKTLKKLPGPKRD